jgi:transcriptional regulator with XRE-family HTH domain
MTQGLALKLKNLIEEKNFSVQGLEKKAGLKINAVRNILTGHSKKPSADLVMAVAKALDYPVGDLLGEEASLAQENALVLKNICFPCHTLLSDTLVLIVKMYAQNKEDVNAQDLMSMTQEIYQYSQENNKGNLDEKFAKWLLNKRFL